jgi:ribose-phosphate pyrophosphokinase
VPVAAASKRRRGDDTVVIDAIVGDVRGRDVIVLDDEIARGSTVIELLSKLREHGVASIRVACTHGLFSAGALGRIGGQADVTEVVCTNTVPIAERHDKLTVLSIAPAMAEAMHRIHNGESVSALFDAPTAAASTAAAGAAG